MANYRGLKRHSFYDAQKREIESDEKDVGLSLQMKSFALFSITSAVTTFAEKSLTNVLTVVEDVLKSRIMHMIFTFTLAFIVFILCLFAAAYTRYVYVLFSNLQDVLSFIWLQIDIICKIFGRNDFPLLDTILTYKIYSFITDFVISFLTRKCCHLDYDDMNSKYRNHKEYFAAKDKFETSSLMSEIQSLKSTNLSEIFKLIVRIFAKTISFITQAGIDMVYELVEYISVKMNELLGRDSPAPVSSHSETETGLETKLHDLADKFKEDDVVDSTPDDRYFSNEQIRLQREIWLNTCYPKISILKPVFFVTVTMLIIFYGLPAMRFFIPLFGLGWSEPVRFLFSNRGNSRLIAIFCAFRIIMALVVCYALSNHRRIEKEELKRLDYVRNNILRCSKKVKQKRTYKFISSPSSLSFFTSPTRSAKGGGRREGGGQGEGDRRGGETTENRDKEESEESNKKRSKKNSLLDQSWKSLKSLRSSFNAAKEFVVYIKDAFGLPFLYFIYFQLLDILKSVKKTFKFFVSRKRESVSVVDATRQIYRVVSLTWSRDEKLNLCEFLRRDYKKSLEASVFYALYKELKKKLDETKEHVDLKLFLDGDIMESAVRRRIEDLQRMAGLSASSSGETRRNEKVDKKDKKDKKDKRKEADKRDEAGDAGEEGEENAEDEEEQLSVAPDDDNRKSQERAIFAQISATFASRDAIDNSLRYFYEYETLLSVKNLVIRQIDLIKSVFQGIKNSSFFENREKIKELVKRCKDRRLKWISDMKSFIEIETEPAFLKSVFYSGRAAAEDSQFEDISDTKRKFGSLCDVLLRLETILLVTLGFLQERNIKSTIEGVLISMTYEVDSNDSTTMYTLELKDPQDFLNINKSLCATYVVTVSSNVFQKFLYNNAPSYTVKECSA